ncbi:MAG TPA: tetratricopeptide repeat protein [Candidatus Lustribacter sp.]|nr:tetratricopeptide repeat protein [Candidatus Lustribacter sp.]
MQDDPLSIDRELERARRLADAGLVDEARHAYLRLVARTPNDLRALNDFGTFLMQRGLRAAARTLYERALAIDPRSALVQANLGNVLFAENDYAAAQSYYEAALAIDPHHAAAHQGLSYALLRLGRDDEALVHRWLGFANRALTTAPYRGTGPPRDVLLCVCAGGGTLYTDAFLDDRIFRTTTLVADMDDGAPLPVVDVIFNAISDADRASAALRSLEQRLAGSASPVINAPARVLATARAANASRLAAVPGVVGPRMATVSRSELLEAGAAVVAAHGFTFPLLVRAPGFHTGEHFARVEAAGDLASAVAAFPGEDVLLVEYIDLRDAGGRVRKYRVMAIDGALYPFHAAVSRDWKVHYFTADMATEPANRAEDERFLADPQAALGAEAWTALERIRDAVGLEYAGIDFGIDRSGRVVVFEANATMIVLPPGPDAMWNYRRAPVERVITAVRAMLLGRR